MGATIRTARPTPWGHRVITSARNEKVAAALRLRKRAFRDADRAFLLEGAQVVAEALDAGAVSRLYHTEPVDPLVSRARAAGAELVHVSEDVMARLTSTVSPQGVLGIAPYRDVELSALPERPGCVALLHAVRDPGNAGTVLRSADAAGASGVVFSSTSVDVYNPKTVRASAGSVFHLPVVRGAETADAVGALRERGLRVLAADARGEDDLYAVDLDGPVAFLFGNEAWGLPDDVATLADRTVRVPIRGAAESLNLAASATVCLFEWARRQREERRATLETIIAAAAHDIRSPLTAMKGFGHALAGKWDRMTDEQRGLMLRGIVYDTDRMNSIVRQLVDAARLVSGGLDLFPERTDVGAVVAQVRDAIALDPDHPGIAWEGGAVEALVDPERLRLVVEAFVESLVWWTIDGPVRVRAELADGRLRLAASRAGARIDGEGAEELFHARAPGTGAGSKIGLYVARGVAEAQGGTAVATVEDGELRFHLDIRAGAAAT
jgi:TrmH family RNA methyltransferase